MKKKWIILLITILIVSLFLWLYKSDFFKPEKEYIPNEYEIGLIDYFKEIALKTEYYDSPEKITKWRKTMSLYIYTEDESNEQIDVISNTIKDINAISSDGFKIEITENYKKANAFLYLCKKEKVKELAPKFYESLIDKSVIDYDYSGLTHVEFKWSNFVITKALIFIDAEYSAEEQKLAIIEELTQSIGLLNDSDKYPDSIFYENDSISNSGNYQYSKMDIDLIRFLYNPMMKPGFKVKSAELVIKKILKDENN